MTIHLPQDLENSIQAAVQGGRFASVDDAMAEAARLLLRELSRKQPQAASLANAGEDTPDPILGLMSDHADLMDEIVEDAMRHREQQPWRLANSE
jgi:Arc/MetJ-type ribon-helix-helix transcriptional regulator